MGFHDCLLACSFSLSPTYTHYSILPKKWLLHFDINACLVLSSCGRLLWMLDFSTCSSVAQPMPSCWIGSKSK